jgi:hypothetical protein
MPMLAQNSIFFYLHFKPVLDKQKLDDTHQQSLYKIEFHIERYKDRFVCPLINRGFYFFEI